MQVVVTNVELRLQWREASRRQHLPGGLGLHLCQANSTFFSGHCQAPRPACVVAMHSLRANTHAPPGSMCL